MFATKGRLKVALLVVGFLIVELGMYGAFQIQEANAHSFSCFFHSHSTSTSISTISITKTGKERRKYLKCHSACPGSSHKQIEYKHDYLKTTRYRRSSGAICHKHGPDREQSKFWYTVECGG